MTRDNRLMTLALFLWGAGEGLFLYILPLYMEQLGATPEEVGVVLALAAFITACSFIPGGLLADHFDPKKVMLGGWIIGGLSSLMMGLAPNWAAFVPGILIYNVSAYCIPAINSTIAEASGDAPLEHTITLTFAGYAAGSILAPLIGGRLADAIGTRWLFIIGSVILLTSLGVVLQIRRHPAHRSSQAPTPSLSARIAGLRPFVPFYARIVLVVFAMMIGATLVANYLSALGWSLGDVNTWGGTAQSMGMMLLAIVLGRLSAGRQRRGLLLGQGLVMLALTMFLITTPSLRITAVAGYFLLGGIAPVRELANAQIAGQVKANVRGIALGVNETLFALGRSGAAALAGILFTANMRLPLIVSLALIPISMAVIALSRAPTLPREAEEIVVMASSGAVLIDAVEE
ncbi:MAG TPA: MFS transporter [Anaerolineae bacterium]